MKKIICFPVICLIAICLLLGGCQSKPVPNTQQSIAEEAGPTETPHSKDGDKETDEVQEGKEENDEVLSGFITMVPSDMYFDCDTTVSIEDCESVTGLPPVFPSYLPENFQQYDKVFVHEYGGFIRQYWYNTQDCAVLEINESEFSREYSEEYFYLDLSLRFPDDSDGYRYCAMRTESADGIAIQGYMFFAEESYEPECRKIIDSIFIAED